MNRTRFPLLQNHGFTLVELMITIAVATLIIAAMYASYILQQRSYNIQGAVVETQQNARVAMDFLTLDLRMAGYDPTGSSGATITAATANSITFTADMDENGAIGTGATPATENETFSYDLNTNVINGINIPTLRRSATMNGSTSLQPMADYIEQVEFCYQFENGTPATTTPTAANLNNIRGVQITMLARAPRSDNKYTNNEIYNRAPCPNAATWGPISDNFRRRVITTRIDLRNMGL